MPPRRAELPGSHDLGTDARTVLLGEGVVDAAASAGFTDHLVPEPRGLEPLDQPIASMTKRRLKALTIAGAEAVQREEEAVDACE